MDEGSGRGPMDLRFSVVCGLLKKKTEAVSLGSVFGQARVNGMAMGFPPGGGLRERAAAQMREAGVGADRAEIKKL